MSRRVAVTGASGFIGRHVTAALAARGDTAVPIQRPFDARALAETFRTVDVVVHLAGVISAAHEREFVAGNVESTRTVARAARDAGTRLVHISSLAAAGPAPPSAPRSEDDPPAPITPYGRTKLEAERVIAGLTGLQWTILRPGVVYGPGDRAVRPLFRWARFGVLPIVGHPSAAYTFIYIDDAIRAIAAAIDRGPHGDTIFLGHARPVATREIAEEIRSTLRSPARLVPIPEAIVRTVSAAGDLAGAISGKPALLNRHRLAELYAPGFVCRVDRMRDRLGIVAETDLREGFRKAAAWYRGSQP
jgi:nucleoside-diphosphate-sugar epimerase